MQRAWIISIGTELTLGQSVDTNAVWLAQQLAGVGIRASRHVTVSDDLAPIVAIFREAAAAADVVIVTGGLGPTDDDLTREGLARASGTELVRDEASLAQIRAFFRGRGRTMPERNHVQAMVPHRGRALANACGTAPGVRVRIGAAEFFALPGVPFEMKAMFDAHVRPELHGGAEVLRSRRIRSYGLPESEVGQLLQDLMARGSNPEVGTTADLGEIGVRINATGPVTGVDAMLDQTEAEIRRRLGRAVFGRDQETLPVAIGSLLTMRNETVCTAESCTGGLIATMLTDIAGSSRYFLGGVVSYDNAAKRDLLGVTSDALDRHGAVSEPVATAMAAGARRQFGATWAISVTGIAGPAGGSEDKPVGLVCIGLAGPADVKVRTLRLGSDSPRSVIRNRAALTALNLMRLELL